MSTNNIYKTDLNKIHDIVQSSMLLYPKEVIIATLRDFFSKDSFYHYSKDKWGFANTTDHTDLPLGADLPHGPGAHSNLNLFQTLPTRVFIGENYRYDGIFYPAILVKSAGSRYVPISINRNKGTIRWENILYEDGYGNSTAINRPKSFVTTGAWEGSIIIEVLSRSLKARDEIVELIGMCFTEIHFDSLYDVGLVVKPISIGSATETEDRNDKLFRQTLTLDIRTEWRREIPISNIIDAIVFTIDFVNLDNPEAPVAQNLTITQELNMVDLLLNLE